MPLSGPHVLFVDDDEIALRSLVRGLKRRTLSFACHEANNARTAMEIASEFQPHAALVDLSLDPALGPESGYQLIAALTARDPTIRILVLTGHGSEETGINALRHGAASFLIKPADIDQLHALISDAIAFCTLKRQYEKLRAASESRRTMDGLTSRSPRMLEALEAVFYASTNNQPVLILGETGTGKGVIAQAIHRASRRARKPFIRVQPSFGSQDLVTSEIFGHEKGAFTGAAGSRVGLIEEAAGGTLFVDEVAELPHETQLLLLHVLQEQVFRRLGSNKELCSDFRLIAATNCPPADLLKKNKLRQDFFHRIAHLTIELPPLCERAEDIEDLAAGFLHAAANRENIAVNRFGDDALTRLLAYRWPGNIRELEAVIEGGVFRAHFEGRHFVAAEDLRIPHHGEALQADAHSFRQRVRRFELQLVQESLTRHGFNQSQAAESLAMDRSTLRRILERADNSE